MKLESGKLKRVDFFVAVEYNFEEDNLLVISSRVFVYLLRPLKNYVRGAVFDGTLYLQRRGGLRRILVFEIRNNIEKSKFWR